MEVISVITPVYNRKEYIRECVESVAESLKGEDLQIEHIVVDDGSDDGMGESLEELGGKYQNLRIINLGKNIGPAGARNAGIEKAVGKYLFFLDSDDLLFQASLVNLYEVIKKTGVGWVYGGFVRGDAQGKYQMGNDYWGSQFENADEALVAMYTGKHFFQHSFMVKKDLVEMVGKYDESLRMAEDFDMCTRLLLAGHNPNYVSSALYMHRNHGDNLSARHIVDPKKHLADMARLREKYKDRFSQQVLSKIL